MITQNPYIIFNPIVYFFQDLFVDWAANDIPDNWVKSGTHDATNGVQEDANGVNLFSDGTLTEFKITKATVGLVESTTYYFELDIHTVTSGGLTFVDGSLTSHDYSTTGKKTGSFVQNAGAPELIKRDAGVNSGVCDIVIKSFRIHDSDIF